MSNDSGSTTSAEATLAVSPENGPIVASNLNLTGAPGVPLTVPYSLLLQNARDPDGD